MSLQALCADTKIFFFFTISLFLNLWIKAFLELKVGKIVRDYNFDTFSNRITELKGPLLTYANTVLS